jgi:hypothetical protein
MTSSAKTKTAGARANQPNFDLDFHVAGQISVLLSFEILTFRGCEAVTVLYFRLKLHLCSLRCLFYL